MDVLEHELQGKLSDARVSRAGHTAKIAGAKVAGRVVNWAWLKALKTSARNWTDNLSVMEGGLLNTEVPVVQAWAVENAAAKIAGDSEFLWEELGG